MPGIKTPIMGLMLGSLPMDPFLTIDYSDNGSTDPVFGTYGCNLNDQASVTAYPNEGYALANWTVDGNYAGPSNPLTLTMDTEHEVMPNFDVGNCLDSGYSLGGAVCVDGGWNWFIPGTQATVEAVADPGYMLANWTVDGNYAGNSSSLTLTMDGNYTVYATFVPAATVSFQAINNAGIEPWSWYTLSGVDVYMDGNYLGPADGSSYVVPLGAHYFSAIAYVYDRLMAT